MSNTTYLESEILLAITMSPRFKVKTREFIDSISKHYAVDLSGIPFRQDSERNPLDTKMLNNFIHKKDVYYNDALQKLLQAFNLNRGNKVHKNVIEDVVFFHKYPDPLNRPKPKIVLDRSSQTPTYSIEVYPWTKQKDVTSAFKAIQSSFKDTDLSVFMSNSPVQIKGASKKEKSYYVGGFTEKDKLKYNYIKHLKLFFIYAPFKKRLLERKGEPPRRLTRAEISSIFDDRSFQQEVEEVFQVVEIDNVIDLERFIQIIPDLAEQLEEYNLFP